jgi:hypothetical protein
MTREEAVQCLVRFDKPLALLRDCIGAFKFDWEGPPLAILRADDVISVLHRWEKGEVNAQEVEDWANLVELRDDLDHDPTNTAVASAVFDLANPELQGPLELIAPALRRGLQP